MGKQVSVIIPTWDGKAYLERCLPAVMAHTGLDCEVVVVDNHSQDGSVEWIGQHFPAVRVIRNEMNVGVAPAINQGIQASEGEYVVALNNDTIVTPGWLVALVEAVQSDPCVGMCAPKMLLCHPPHLFDAAGIEVDRAGIAWNRWGGDAEEDHPNRELEQVFGPCAGAALYRRAMLDDIGLFDEDFFAYLEDVDLAWRAQWAGWKCVYVPEAVIYHAHSATAREGSHFKNRLLGRNKIWTLCKNHPLAPLLWYVPLILAYDLMAVGYAIAIGRGPGAVQGRIAALSKLPRMLTKRRRIVRRVSSRTIMARLHPLENPLAVVSRYAHIRVTGGGQDVAPGSASRGD